MLAERLKEVRELRGFSQRELADRCGLTNLQIWRYENDEARPNAEFIVKIATALSVTADYLLGLSDNIEGSHAADDLSVSERKLIQAIRDREFIDALDLFRALIAPERKMLQVIDSKTASEMLARQMTRVQEGQKNIFSNDALRSFAKKYLEDHHSTAEGDLEPDE